MVKFFIIVKKIQWKYCLQITFRVTANQNDTYNEYKWSALFDGSEATEWCNEEDEHAYYNK